MDDTQRAEQLLSAAVEQLNHIQTYSCVVLCQDRIDGRERKLERILSYFRAPKSVYLRWLPGPYERLQVSHVPERDGERHFMARETGLKGLVGAQRWPHNAPLIDKMYPHHFRAHETSVFFLVQLSQEIATRARSMGKVRIRKVQEVSDPWLKRAATLVDSEMSSDPLDGLRWPRTELYFDTETKLPLHFRLHDFGGGLFGEYGFSEFKANAALGPEVFDLKKL